MTRPRLSLPILLTLAVGLSVGSGATLWMSHRHATLVTPKTLYHCPMHPEIVREEPGDCPVCGMRLVATGPTPPPGERKIAFYRNPMDPSVHSPVPMDDSMGMAYIPVYEDELSGQASVPGLADITIDPAYQRLIGVRTVLVEEATVGGAWTTPAKVVADETRVAKIHVKTGGFVDKLYVDFMGKPVRRGQPLFALYSPDLFSAQQDLASAVKAQESLGSEGHTLVEAASDRLRLWDVPEGEIRRLQAGGAPQRDLVFVSPVSGVVTGKTVVQGARLLPGDTPLEITDLSTVWVQADAYTEDLSKIHLGERATFTTPAVPGRVFKGRVAFVDPVLDAQTRTAKVRLAFPNPKGVLRPETYGEAVLQSGVSKGLRIPFDAVLEDGARTVVFVDEGEGHFSPREVKLGAQDADWVEVKQGLEAGERVAVKANFLLDADARRKAALKGGSK